MGYKEKPKVRKQGGSYYIVLPKSWLDFWEIKEGDEVVQVGNAILVTAPKKLEGKAKKIVLGELGIEKESQKPQGMAGEGSEER